MGGEAATGGGDVSTGTEGFVDDVDAGGNDPRLADVVCAGRNTVKQPKLSRHQSAGALGSNELASWIEAPQHSHDLGVLDDLAGLRTAADNNSVGSAGILKRGHGLDDDAVHGADLGGRTGDGHPKVIQVEPVEDAKRDQ